MKKIIGFALAMFALSVSAQQVELQSFVISSGGGFEEKDGYSVSYTIGEVVTGTLELGGYTIVQGFQQAFIEDTTSLLASQKYIDINIYPNPAKSYINIQLSDSDNEVAMIHCYDMTGKEVFAQETELGLTTKIDVTDLPQGLYFVRIIADDQILATQKFAKL
ncbi:MAG: T9SS type A sorting domain-containing protein [Salinivirgaceae bacterium]|nr:T9SS type A sorting domain-containing protein [Salinivirgaceae bacterium]